MSFVKPCARCGDKFEANHRNHRMQLHCAPCRRDIKKAKRARHASNVKLRCENEPAYGEAYATTRANKLRRKYKRRHELKKARRKSDPVYATEHANKEYAKYLRKNAIKIVDRNCKRLQRREEKEQQRLAVAARREQREQIRMIREKAREARRVAPLVDPQTRAELSKLRKYARRKTEKYAIKTRVRDSRRHANRRRLVQALCELGWLPQLNLQHRNTWKPTDVQGAFRDAFGMPYIVIPRSQHWLRSMSYSCYVRVAGGWRHRPYVTPAMLTFAETMRYCVTRHRKRNDKRPKKPEKSRTREKQVSATITALREMGWLNGYEIVTSGLKSTDK
jgi:hypothetical protein